MKHSPEMEILMNAAFDKAKFVAPARVDGAPEEQPHAARCSVAIGSLPVSSAEVLVNAWEARAVEHQRLAAECAALDRRDMASILRADAHAFQFCADQLRRADSGLERAPAGRERLRSATGAKPMTKEPQKGPSAPVGCSDRFGIPRECATKVERIRQPGKWDHCPERVVCSFVDKGERVPLCERCARNVRRGDYGARLRDLLNEQVPNKVDSTSSEP